VKPAATLIAIGIGAQSEGRRWPLACFAGTVNQVGETRKVQPLIICSAAELGEALKLGELLRIAPVIVSGAMLREAGAVLERCDLLIGNDSGCAHLAAAVGCPAVVISRHPCNGDPDHFNSPVRFAPRGPQVQVLQPAAGRGTCGDACDVLGPHCILEVCVEDVTAAALRMLETQATRVATPAKPQVPPQPARLLHVHSAQAMRRVVETLRHDIDRPSL